MEVPFPERREDVPADRRKIAHIFKIHVMRDADGILTQANQDERVLFAFTRPTAALSTGPALHDDDPVFRRGANVTLPPDVPFTPPQLNPPESVASADEIARGRDLYEANCALCHDVPGNAGGLFRRGLFPDLAFSPALASREAFAAIVLDGARATNGMAAYRGVLDDDEAEAIRAHIVDRANAALAARGGGGR